MPHARSLQNLFYRSRISCGAKLLRAVTFLNEDFEPAEGGGLEASSVSVRI